MKRKAKTGPKGKVKRRKKNDAEVGDNLEEVRVEPELAGQVNPFERSFDHYFRLSCGEDLHKWCSANGHVWKVGLTKILDTLRRGFGDRVELVDMMTETEKSLPCSEGPPLLEERNEQSVLIGLRLVAGSRIESVTRGPVANSSLANEFRQFWGDLSELRKFSDGVICEAVVWDTKTRRAAEMIPCQIAKHLLQLHFGIPAEKLKYVGPELESVITSKIDSNPANCKIGEYQGRRKAIVDGFVKLSQSLRTVDGLALGVAAVAPVDAQLRNSEPFYALDASVGDCSKSTSVHNSIRIPKSGSTTPCPPFIPSVDVHITLENSGKWPDDLKAVRRLKTAFYLQLADSLTQQFKFLCFPKIDCLLVQVDGYVYRLVIAVAKEVTLLKKSKYEGGTVLKDTAESKALEQTTVRRAKIAAWLYSVSQQHESYGIACGLAKRWLCCHMLTDYLSEEALELLVASLYVNPQTLTAPGSGLAAFGRFLSLLATQDWLTSPVIVNFTSAWSAEKVEEILKQFVKFRPTLPTVCICTPDDELGSCWTRSQPIAMIADRMAKLAVSSLSLIDRHILQAQPVNLFGAFVTSLSGYDVVIKLRGRQVTRKPERWLDLAEGQEESVKDEKRERNLLPVVDFDPVEQYVQELRRAYDSLALFFYDRYGGDCVGVLWKPNALPFCEPKISRVLGRQMVCENGGEDGKLSVNIPAILEDFSLIGHGLVRQVEDITRKGLKFELSEDS